ncbi:type IV pilin-like G/H family protein [Chamaesiphon polymorphus]|uniref:Prepilin-type cleavage/methylation domain-containing protein n=1 Tax=Chamaesiphon polymorphus CCALA 037 TaxID=2107692 RepID=A0A2T1GH13_9CYAN|nr:type IV pilin-like G/H family protein [Chamaesiphon polymorphus]PSB56953.1 prepilin-type cleavage/methylation domain-containing protein [Chamaesiphon polymorphus CCALA 037]
MKIEFQSKFIQHLSRKQGERGFTLVELLVVIIIIGILAAVSLPSFLNQSAKAKQSEAKQNIGAINRIQSALRVANTSFASTFDAIALGSLAGSSSTATTDNYSYALTGTIDTATIVAQSNDTSLKSYTGGNIRYANTQSQSVATSAVCETLSPGTSTVATPTFSITAGVLTTSCGAGMTQLGT